MKHFQGSNFFRQRLVLSTLSGKAVRIERIRENNLDDVGLKEYEISFIRLLDTLTNGSKIVVNETGTSVSYTPGLLLGGKLEHNCSNQRAIGYYLEPLLYLAPFCKKSLCIRLHGMTNDEIDPSVDAIKMSSFPVLKRFISCENLELKIISRGMAPLGGGEVLFTCPVVNYLRPLQIIHQGKIKRVRGIAYSVRVSPAFSTRIIDAVKSFLLKYLPDVYIYSDNYKGKHSGKSPGFGVTLVAETTTGVFYAAEATSHPTGSKCDQLVPEDVAKKAVFNLFEEIYRGGCVDSSNQPLMFLFMALGTRDISKVKMGPLSPYSIKFLRHMEHFFELRMKLETEESEDLKMGAHKVLATCVGIDFVNINKPTT